MCGVSKAQLDGLRQQVINYREDGSSASSSQSQPNYNTTFPMSDPLGQGQPLSQPQQMGTQGETYIQRATPKFNFRSSPFMIQTQPDQETGDSGLNLG